MPLRSDIKKVLVIGSGPIVIGQAAEFDYAGTQACLALKEENIEVILLNDNPATIMTDQTVADRVYLEPLTVQSVEAIIQKERPDGIIGTLGGQTGLNLAVELDVKGILKKYHVALLGTSTASIQLGEDRDQFRSLMLAIGEPIPESKIVHTYEEGQQFAEDIGYPVIIRPAYTLGGTGGGFAENETELRAVLTQGLQLSPIHQVLIEKSIKGWKEIEYEVMRDDNDTCIIVCNMENLDPVGVHTGDSIVVAPSQTLNDVQYQMLRSASLKIIRALNVVGGCNIQFALDPSSNDYRIIEVNPRVSRSSALASKATGYPIARIAAKCAVGYHLDEIKNPVTGTTFASFEPALDYIIVKLPRFPFDKFKNAERTLGTQMKATGEVMALERTFEGALNKGLRSMELKGVAGLSYSAFKTAGDEELDHHLVKATDLRLFAIAERFRRGATVQEIWRITAIDPWFLEKIYGLIEMEKQLAAYDWRLVPESLLIKAKRLNMSDQWLANCFQIEETVVREKWKSLGLKPSYKWVDTCAAEFEADTPYYYSTWQGIDEVFPSDKPKILIIGSGPIRIGQGIEFDYCSVQAALAVKDKGYEAIVINNNPETVSTDYLIADHLYFEPLAFEDVMNVIEKEKPVGVLLQFGGQTAINLAKALEKAGVPILGTSPDAMDVLEDRERFYQLLESLAIPHIQGETVHSIDQLKAVCADVGFPILIRPSYVIGGEAMTVIHDHESFDQYLKDLPATFNERSWPLLVDRYVAGLECEVDAVSDGEYVMIPGIFEHIEKAGVHSGDSVAIFPSVSLSGTIKKRIEAYTRSICQSLKIIGLINVQFVIANDTVYILEVNPRASRTIPIVSKITDIPMVKAAVVAQLGDTLTEQGRQVGLLAPPDFYSIKTPVFSTFKLNLVDPVLAPEMKSTGERLSMGLTIEEAMEKALDTGRLEFCDKKPIIICAIADRDKAESVELIKSLAERGFTILASAGTRRWFNQTGLNNIEAFDDIDMLEQTMAMGKVAAVINTPTKGSRPQTFGYQLRTLALRYHIPLFTRLDTVEAMIKWGRPAGSRAARALAEYHQIKMIKKGSDGH
ncbi:carbamoyl-phosphate synthase (glutamine-hydrolyzing) large subunit [Camelliibacillus cellulosilyticus]|uniref:Carbamoyl phosphate synthase large chain n=1 Tax=Camelliibacillus cellulosilyticus TaxID=2174486 RepID=A0ABV9GHD0_9BACL